MAAGGWACPAQGVEPRGRVSIGRRPTIDPSRNAGRPGRRLQRLPTEATASGRRSSGAKSEVRLLRACACGARASTVLVAAQRQWGARRAALAPREFRSLWDCLSRFHRRLFCDGSHPARGSRARAAPQSSPVRTRCARLRCGFRAAPSAPRRASPLVTRRR